ncbi:MAG TPA: hypothetical protein VL992_06975 [Tepidisphaeraceae bacterium]|nr:hypothetical protein [Tepidisphaeraceae bacterium]
MFSLDDFISQLDQVRKFGSFSKLIDMVPGTSQLTQRMGMKDGDADSQMRRMRAIYDSMNKAERKNPYILDDDRRQRVSRGAGVVRDEVIQFIKQYNVVRNMMGKIFDV